METRGRRRCGWSHGGAGVAGSRCWSVTVVAFRRERDVVAAVQWERDGWLHSGVSYGGRTGSGGNGGGGCGMDWRWKERKS
ncbi:hypothetical protein DEO72_LG4g1686 [Vigna unguiculata]|nr:hypothetical protein DEO72_LG3g1920 [Vigna unguiculata]QCD90726.1 hypothetical protein DEO72_LG4g1686 [Vigna unguiculata]